MKALLKLNAGFILAATSVLVVSTASGQSAVKTPPTATAQEKAGGSGEKTDGSTTKTDGSAMKADASAAKAAEPITFSVAEGALNFTASGTWKSVPPKSRMLEHEIKVPRIESDKRDGRLTIMGAGGSIAANIARWEGQFTQPDGSATEAKVTEMVVEEMDVKMVDISGTYTETMGGPFSGGKKVENADFRVLAAIIETGDKGNYFVKLIGPKATIAANEKAFEDTIKSIKVQE